VQDQSSLPGGMPLPPPPSNLPSMPGSGSAFAPVLDRARLRELAIRQRWAIIAGIANAVGGMLLFTHALPDGLAAVASLVILVAIVVSAYRLGRILYSVGIGILSAVAMFIPFVWIAVLVALSVKASKELKASGIRVGFFGTSTNSI
jgi:hypothetical protein